MTSSKSQIITTAMDDLTKLLEPDGFIFDVVSNEPHSLHRIGHCPVLDVCLTGTESDGGRLRVKLRPTGASEHCWTEPSKSGLDGAYHLRGPRIGESELRWLANQILVHTLTVRLAVQRGLTTPDGPDCKDDLAAFPPFRFITVHPVSDGYGRWYFEHVYDRCLVTNVVTINEDLSVSADGTYEPDTECWFYVTGDPADSSSVTSPDIIVSQRGDELVYYPVVNGRVSCHLRRRCDRCICAEMLTEFDCNLIRQAISRFLWSGGPAITT